MLFCHASNRPLLFGLLFPSLGALCLGLLLSGCGSESTANTEPAPADTYFPIRLGETRVRLQLALTPGERQKGLMFRDALETDHGMLFLFERPERRGFWMKNTRIPLDVGYFDPSGRLLEVYPLYPYDETPVPSRSDRILLAVETDRGWYEANGVEPGSTLDMEALKAAVSERGFNLANFAIED